MTKKVQGDSADWETVGIRCRNRFTTLGCVVLAVLLVSVAEAQEHGESHQQHFHRNEVAFLMAGTYEASEDANFVTFGAEYARLFTERFGVIAEFETLPKPDAWIFVVPFAYKVAGELEVFAGPGIEHLARRSRRKEAEGTDLEDIDHRERIAESGADNLFLFRIGAGYHIPLGDRFFMTPSFAFDLINEENEVAKAFVYGVTVGFGF